LIWSRLVSVSEVPTTMFSVVIVSRSIASM
jgi:hypothetical protein